MNIAFVGLGAIGASFASQMKDHGIDPLVLCDPARKARYAKNGFLVNQKRYDFEYITPEETHVKADLIFVVVKYHDLPRVIDQMANLVGPDTAIISLMNGIDSEAMIGQRYGMDRLVNAYVVALDGVREGQSIRYTSPGQIIYGLMQGGADWRTDRVRDVLRAAGINYLHEPDIRKKQWWKFMVNAGANQLSAILNANYGAMKQVPPLRRLLREAMHEVIDLSRFEGVELEESDIDLFFDMIENLSDDGITSMHQDVLAHRKTEVEMLAGQVIALGHRYGVATPVNTLLLDMIHTIELLYNMNKM